MERNVACYLMAAHFKPEEVAGLRAHPKLLTTAFTTHLMLSKTVPGNEQRMKAFNDGLREIRKSKQFAQKLQVPGCALGAAAS
jgi:polar amino acid transport system substrate-binding protein